MTEQGNWEHSNILWLHKTLDDIAIDKNIDAVVLKNKIANCKNILLDARTKRIRPLLDDKTLCSWNALINTAYSKAFAATGNNHYKDIAEKNMDFILAKMVDGVELKHCYKNNIAYIDGFLDDYGYLTWALIHLQEITGKQEYLFKAKELLDALMVKFGDAASALFYYSSINQKNMIARKIDVYDGATPSANSIVALCLQYLSVVFKDEILRKRFLQMLVSLEPAIVKHPTSFGVWSAAMQMDIKTAKEVVVVGEGSSAVITSIVELYQPNKVVVVSSVENSKILPILSDKIYTQKPVYYLCQNNTCLQPLNSVSEFLHFYNK